MKINKIDKDIRHKTVYEALDELFKKDKSFIMLRPYGYTRYICQYDSKPESRIDFWEKLWQNIHQTEFKYKVVGVIDLIDDGDNLGVYFYINSCYFSKIYAYLKSIDEKSVKDTRRIFVEDGYATKDYWAKADELKIQSRF